MGGFARNLLPGANMTIVALRDDAQSILLAAARDMLNPQSLPQQASKSKGDGGAPTLASDRPGQRSGGAIHDGVAQLQRHGEAVPSITTRSTTIDRTRQRGSSSTRRTWTGTRS